MQRKLVGGLMIFALLFCVRTAWVAAAGDDGDIAAEVRAALKQLDSGSDRTAASRLNLAKIAISSATAKGTKDPKAAADAWEAAREALVDADRVEPNNKEVATLLASVQKHIPAATQPATKPVAEPPATKPGPATQAAASDAIVKREVTAAEINRIRQIEWRHDENPPPRIQIDPEMRKKFLAASTDITPREFNQLTPIAQAAAILDSKKEDFFPAVNIRTDPASLREFRTSVDMMVVQNCGSCHKDNKAGRFSLFTQKNEAATFSNFIILQSYTTTIHDAQRLMVDRTTPESSLLLSFLLPAAQTDTPHPETPGFKPPAKTKADPKYQLALKWLKTLDTLAPSYGIDLSEDVPVVPPAPKK